MESLGLLIIIIILVLINITNYRDAQRYRKELLELRKRYTQLQQSQTNPKTLLQQSQVNPQTQQQQIRISETKQPTKVHRKISTMSLVFTIGVLFIVIAGAIFATTTWSVLPNLIKASLMVFLITVFFGAAYLARRKLELQQTSLTFYSLACCFIPLSFLGMGYFRLLGEFFSVEGAGRYLLALSACICLSVACRLGFRIYQNKLYVWFTYAAVTAAVYAISCQISSRIDVRWLFMMIYCMLLLAAKKVLKENNREPYAYSKYMEVLLCFNTVMILLEMFRNMSFPYVRGNGVWALSMLFIIVVMTYYIISCEQKWMKTIHPFITVALICGYFDFNWFLLVALLIVFLFYFFLKVKGENVLRTRVSDFLFSFVSILLFLFSSETQMERFAWILISIMLLVLSTEHVQKWYTKLACYLLPWTMVFSYFAMRDVAELVRNLEELVYLLLVVSVVLSLLLVFGKIGSFLDRYLIPFLIVIGFWGPLMTIAMYLFDKNEYVLAYSFLVFVVLGCLLKRCCSELSQSPYLETALGSISGIFVFGSIMIETACHIFLPEWSNVTNHMVMALIFFSIACIYEWVGGRITNERLCKGIRYLIPSILYFFLIVVDFNYLIKPEDYFFYGLVVTIICFLYQILLRKRKQNLVSGFVSLTVLVVNIVCMTEWLDFDDGVSCLIMLFLYIVFFLCSLMFHHGHKMVEREEQTEGEEGVVVIDWYRILMILPILYLWYYDAGSLWTTCTNILLSIYALMYYNKISEKANPWILSVSAFWLYIAWRTQHIWKVPNLIRTEWNMLPAVSYTAFLYRVVWRGKEKIFSWIFYATVALCMFVQAMDAIHSMELIDILLLGISAFLIFILSFYFKRKRWFLLSAVTLVSLCFYVSRSFWLSLAWWVYLLVVGVSLITIASLNEYYKKTGKTREKRFMQEWTW